MSMMGANLVNRAVKIEWRPDEEDLWPYYNVVEIDCAAGFILLHGIEDPQGRKYEGGEFWQSLAEISTIAVIRSRP